MEERALGLMGTIGEMDKWRQRAKHAEAVRDLAISALRELAKVHRLSPNMTEAMYGHETQQYAQQVLKELDEAITPPGSSPTPNP